jgi:hypothetical protein
MRLNDLEMRGADIHHDPERKVQNGSFVLPSSKGVSLEPYPRRLLYPVVHALFSEASGKDRTVIRMIL